MQTRGKIQAKYREGAVRGNLTPQAAKESAAGLIAGALLQISRVKAREVVPSKKVQLLNSIGTANWLPGKSGAAPQ